MADNILSVTQINEYIRQRMDADPVLTNICVKGEISNYKLYPSGHHYFTLKDENSALKCVLFRFNATHLRFRPENGMKIIATGRISVYPRDGAYQLYCNSLTVDGVGDLHVAFEQLKNKLSALGLFDPAHKKPIPRFPQTIGIVTSSAGAAVHDMLRILRARYPIAKVLLFPVRVQGAEAPPEISAAIQYANKHRLADVLIVGRGGGSIEDLWAFNDESVAYAIYQSEIPVISAVGHEPDVTISDYVADLRAATPSNAAELCVPDQMALHQYMDKLSAQMISTLTRRVNAARQHLNVLSSSAVLRAPDQYIARQRTAVNSSKDRFASAFIRLLQNKRMKYVACASKLDTLSPLKVLSRGFALTQTDSGEIIKSVTQVAVGDQVHIAINDGNICASITKITEGSHGTS